MADLGEMPLHAVEDAALGPALKHFRHERPPRRQRLDREVQRQIGQRHDPQMVGIGVPRRIGRHVRQHQIGFPAHQPRQAPRHRVIHEIPLHDGRARDRIDREQVDADHLRGPALDQNLRPAARRGAKVDAAQPAADEMETLIQLDQLERRARAVALLLCRPHVGVIELARQPFLRRRRPPARGAQRDGQAARRPRRTFRRHR